MTFDVAGEAYGRFMGRYSEPLARCSPTGSGCGGGSGCSTSAADPGALTSVLIDRVGVDPSPPSTRPRRSSSRSAGASPSSTSTWHPPSSCPSTTGCFDQTLAQLVVHFMQDPVTGLGEMARVTTRGGTVAACVGTSPATAPRSVLSGPAARRLDPGIVDESNRNGRA